MLLRLPLLEALLHPGGAQLLAQVVDALTSSPLSTEGQPAALLERFVAGCANVAGQRATGTFFDSLSDDALLAMLGSGVGATPPRSA